MTTLKDLIGAMVAWAQRHGLLPEPGSNANARHHRRPGAPAQVYVNRITARMARERLELAAQRTSDAYRASRAAMRQQNIGARRMPARARFAPVAAAAGVASREAAAIGVSTARRTGAGVHRWVRGVNDTHHNRAAAILAAKQTALAALKRAPGEMTFWDNLVHA